MLINSVIHVPTNHCKRDTAQWGEGRATRTRRKGQVCRGNANIQGWVLARATTRVRRDACAKVKNKSQVSDVDEGARGHSTKREKDAHIEARSFTPKDLLTSWTIILSLPPSPVSSGTSIAAACASASSG